MLLGNFSMLQMQSIKHTIQQSGHTVSPPPVHPRRIRVERKNIVASNDTGGGYGAPFGMEDWAENTPQLL